MKPNLLIHIITKKNLLHKDREVLIFSHSLKGLLFYIKSLTFTVLNKSNKRKMSLSTLQISVFLKDS